jgi:2-pyrone-4,6-dicarboxylate lactonase
MSQVPLISLPLRPLETLSRPTFAVPVGAWDVHVHIFGPERSYPHVAQPHYTLPDGNLAQYRRLMPFIGVQRFAIVQPSFYGTDNSCLLDTLDEIGAVARGVVMIDTEIADSELQRFHDKGVRAVRLDLFKRAQLPLAQVQSYILEVEARVRPLGWHLQFYAPGYLVRDLVGFFRTLRIDFVIDHMGYMLEEDGLKSQDFAALLNLLDTGHCYLKLSGAYRIAKNRGYDFVEPVAKAIVDRAPERAVWGSDWPHISYSDRDTGELVSLLERWAPTAAVREKILVDNPNRLFREG